MTKLLPQKRQTYTEKQRFIVYVLWLHGATESTAGKVAGLRKKQVAGIIARSEYTNRGAMTLDQRAAYLRELAAIRYDEQGKPVDDGLLPDLVFMPSTG
ncbi:hypothetical protein H9Q09_00950 [Aurantimonas sp. DM33-3]|uniref:hypothetical protein n=1 Tax=Aurantimonas sp. DM33-3 TaxID=2766955 RepID=UPI001652A7A2|nr:hypothetical protein [Aurantimonas sp. DM33-3]MBC6714752.1 hypothetical protein [Aurantimonas sp. DM33-3]